MDVIHTALSEEPFVAAWAEGHTLALEQAVAMALEALGVTAPVRTSGGSFVS